MTALLITWWGDITNLCHLEGTPRLVEHCDLEHNRRSQLVRQMSPRSPCECPHLALVPLQVGFDVCANTFFSPAEFKAERE